MAGKCILCGGKLRNGICTECGMDNNKSDAAYRSQVNRSQCEDAPLTHVHGEESTELYRKPALNHPRQQQYSPSGQGGNAAKKNQGAGKAPGKYTLNGGNTKNTVDFNRLRDMSKRPGGSGMYSPGRGRSSNKAGITVVVVAVLAGMILVSIGYANKSETTVTTEKIINEPDYQEPFDYQQPYDYPEYTFDPYQYTTKELAPDGENWDTELSAGAYMVGYDIPEGRYVAEGGEGMRLEVADMDSNVWFSEYFGEDENQVQQLDDVRLFTGAIVMVNGGGNIHITSENAQTEAVVTPSANPLTEEITLTDTMVAGEDFPEGTYDIVIAADDFGIVTYELPKEQGQEYGLNFSFLMDSSPSGEYPDYTREYKNAVLPKGTTVTADELTIKLVPSSRIISEDYNAFYDNYS